MIGFDIREVPRHVRVGAGPDVVRPERIGLIDEGDPGAAPRTPLHGPLLCQLERVA